MIHIGQDDLTHFRKLYDEAVYDGNEERIAVAKQMLDMVEEKYKNQLEGKVDNESDSLE